MQAFSESGAIVYLADCVNLMKTMPSGSVDMVFADSPYRLSRGGVTVNSGRLALVDKGAWDRSMGFAEDHRFNVRWLKEACRILKPEGTIWVTGTHHIIFIHPPHHLQPRFRPAVDETQDHKPDYVGETRPTS